MGVATGETLPTHVPGLRFDDAPRRKPPRSTTMTWLLALAACLAVLFVVWQATQGAPSPAQPSSPRPTSFGGTKAPGAGSGHTQVASSTTTSDSTAAGMTSDPAQADPGDVTSSTTTSTPPQPASTTSSTPPTTSSSTSTTSDGWTTGSQTSTSTCTGNGNGHGNCK